MNSLTALQRREDGRWVYTYNGIPWGYCRIPSAECSESYHGDGHETEEQALECYKRYQLDNALRFTPEDMDRGSQFHRCQAEGCKQITNGSAWIGSYTHFSLCRDHQTREDVSNIYTVPAQSWQS